MAREPRWAATARQERLDIRRAVLKLPLYDALAKPAKDLAKFDDLYLVLLDGKIMDPEGREYKSDEGRLILNLMAIKCGALLAIKRPSNELASELLLSYERNFPQFVPSAGDGQLSQIAALTRYVNTHRSNMASVAAQLLRAALGFGDMDLSAFLGASGHFDERANRENVSILMSVIERIGLEISCAKYLQGLTESVSMDDIDGLMHLLKAGPSDVKAYARLGERLSAKKGAKRVKAMAERLRIAYPKTIGSFDADHAEFLQERHADRCPEAILIGQEAAGAEAAGRLIQPRTEEEDRRELGSRFPRLLGLMHKMDESDRLFRQRMREIIRVRRIPLDFISRNLVSHEQGSIDALVRCYELSLSDAPIQDPPSKKNGSQQFSVKPSSKPPIPGKADCKRAPVSMHGFLDSIRLSDGSREFIRSKGFSPKDIVYSICKGFEFGKSISAVGNAHIKGPHIRANIARYLDSAYQSDRSKKPSAEVVIEFLRSIDLIRDFRSRATGTKDNSMSINTAPGHPIGQDVLASLNSAFIELHRGQRR